MVQAPDFRLNNPSYNAVKINITNPKVNAGSNGVEVNSPQNGEGNCFQFAENTSWTHGK